MLLTAPDGWTLKGVGDRAILAVLLYHGLRREEAAHLATLMRPHEKNHPFELEGEGGDFHHAKAVLVKCSKTFPKYGANEQ